MVIYSNDIHGVCMSTLLDKTQTSSVFLRVRYLGIFCFYIPLTGLTAKLPKVCFKPQNVFH